MNNKTKTAPTTRPCGHCGSADIFVEREDLSAYQARCNDCGARGPIVEDGRYDEEAGGAAALAAWNARTPTAAPEVPEGSEGVREALCWAMDEIDALSNHISKFAYPQGMAMVNRDGQIGTYRKACEVRAMLSASPQPAKQGWLPIETAPKIDRHEVLALTQFPYEKEPRRRILCWNDGIGKAAYNWPCWMCSVTTTSVPDKVILGFQPLPPPPAASAGEGK